jgi:hypothetical protein
MPRIYLLGLAIAVFVVGIRLLPGSFSLFRTRDVDYMLNRSVPFIRRLGLFLLEVAVIYLLFTVAVLYQGMDIRF